ncbi:hypothetical protein ACJJIR_03045 [Microbulbifer sp. SSSA008]|uniref:hypothetical protein n=1 Tax=Microbulbifer sp. SSSA008 TaxID=3243380 RepID=UPI00403A3D27
MKYINIEDVIASIPDNEIEKLHNLNNSLTTKNAEERKAIIDSGGAHWGKIKDYLESASHRKCWYTESKNDGSLYDIDHFRPKSAVFNGDTLIYWYWFLAFELKNYRLSCRIANSLKKNPETGKTGGKGNHFELLPGSPRASDIDGISSEEPVLLDPCVESDTKLVQFLPDGRPTLAVHCQNEETSKMRVEVSKLRLNLDYPTFNSGREEIYNEIKKWVIRGDNGLDLNLVKGEIRSKISPSAPYSSAAKCYLRGFRDRIWIEDLIFEP